MDTGKEIDTDLPHGVHVVLRREAGQEHYEVELRIEKPGTLSMQWGTARLLASRLSDAAARAERYNSNEFLNGCLVEYFEWAVQELKGTPQAANESPAPTTH